MASRDNCSEIEIVNERDVAAKGYGTSMTMAEPENRESREMGNNEKQIREEHK